MKRAIIIIALAIGSLTSCGKYSKECKGTMTQIKGCESEIKRLEKEYYQAIQNNQQAQANNILSKISYYNERILKLEDYYLENCD